MRKFFRLLNEASVLQRLRVFVGIVLLGAAAPMFCFAVDSGTTEDPATLCPVCHKGSLTLTPLCNTLDYRRHKDHGDPDGACAGSTISPPIKISPSATDDVGSSPGGG